MIKAVLFDVDGVLIDTFEGNRKAFNHILKALGSREMTAEDYRRFYNRPAKDIFMNFLPGKSQKEIEEIAVRFIGVFADFFKYDRLNPHVSETLDMLKSNFNLGIVTNRRNSIILDFFGISKYFCVVVCLSDVTNNKPHPEPINLALKRLRIRPEEAVYVGDAHSDLEAGMAAGAKVIIYSNPEVKGDFNITDFREIPGIIEKLNAK